MQKILVFAMIATFGFCFLIPNPQALLSKKFLSSTQQISIPSSFEIDYSLYDYSIFSKRITDIHITGT